MKDKKLAYEKELKNDEKRMKNLIDLKKELNERVVNKKVFSVRFETLLNEIATLAKINVNDIHYRISTNAYYADLNKRTMTSMKELSKQFKDEIQAYIRFKDKISSRIQFIHFTTLLNYDEQLSNGDNLSKHLYLKYSNDPNTYEIFTKVYIRKNAYNNLIFNFNLNDVIVDSDDYSKKLLSQAILNCVKRDEEKIK